MTRPRAKDDPMTTLRRLRKEFGGAKGLKAALTDADREAAIDFLRRWPRVSKLHPHVSLRKRWEQIKARPDFAELMAEARKR